MDQCPPRSFPTRDAAQYYDEGASGRCAAYDPFNKISEASELVDAHKYTIQPLEIGKCGSCSTAEKKFLTGEELSVRGKVVCLQNDFNLVKMYYVQGIKGLLAVYSREVQELTARARTRCAMRFGRARALILSLPTLFLSPRSS